MSFCSYIADIWKASIGKNATTWQGAKNGTVECASTHSKYLQPTGHQNAILADEVCDRGEKTMNF